MSSTQTSTYPFLYLYCDSGQYSYGRVLIRGAIERSRWDSFEKMTEKYPMTSVEIDGDLKGQPEICAKELYDFIKVYRDKDTIIKLVEADQILEMKPCLALFEMLESKMENIDKIVSGNIIITVPFINLWKPPTNSKSDGWLNIDREKKVIMSDDLFTKLEEKIEKSYDLSIKEVFDHDELKVHRKHNKISCETLGDLWDQLEIEDAEDVFNSEKGYFNPCSYVSYKNHKLFEFLEKIKV